MLVFFDFQSVVSDFNHCFSMKVNLDTIPMVGDFVTFDFADFAAAFGDNEKTMTAFESIFDRDAKFVQFKVIEREFFAVYSAKGAVNVYLTFNKWF